MQPELKFDPDDHHRLRYAFMLWIMGRTVKRDESLLDLGCADGGRTVIYATLCENAVGIDTSETPKIKALNTQYIRCDWDHLPFKEKCFDVVTWDNGPEHSRDPSKTIEEIFRVCRRETIICAPHEPDLAVKLQQHGHLHEFTHLSLEKIVAERFFILESYLLKHGYGGYNYIVVRGLKHKSQSA